MSARIIVTQNFQEISRGLLSVDGMADYNFKSKRMVQICLSINNIFTGLHNQIKFKKW